MNLPAILEPDGEFYVTLESGESVALPICHPTFQKWIGEKPPFAYGSKPTINYKGECAFAELAIARILVDAGWESVWVETYGGTHFLKEMPGGWKLAASNVTIPED